MHISSLINDYIKGPKIGLNKYLNYYTALGNINKVIAEATLAMLPNGKKHFHQRRLKNLVMKSVMNKLLAKSNEIVMCSKFDEIIKIVSDESEEGFGKLAIYDTALRIGSFLSIYPDKVYLHAGTFKGAKALGLNVRGGFIDKASMPQIFHRLEAYEIEDFLCIYKKDLKSVSFKILNPNSIRIKKATIA